MSWAGTYRRVMRLLEPFAGYILKRRIKSGKEDEARTGERKGIASLTRPDGRLVWMHGASVGETSMLLPLIKRLLEEDPTLHILVTSGTMTSAKIMAERLPPRAFHQMAPLDGPNFVARFLSHWKPDLAVWAESEIWPNLVLQTKSSGAKMALINARMSQNSVDRWRKKRAFARQIFSTFDIILPADTLTHNALKFLGGNVISQIGNLKTAAPALEFDAKDSLKLKNAIGHRPVWLAASTHGPEEAQILEAHIAGPGKRADALLIWVPRHPERGGEIAALCAGHDIALRSKGEVPTDATSIYVMDTLGEMGLALDLADVAFIGGSLHDSLMGHNPLEPARAGVPILTGPHIASFTELYATFFNHKAAIRVTSAKKLEKSVLALLKDPAAARQMAGRAKSLAEESAGILDYTIAKLRSLL
jgi:3-deoxy-D-manno-octulosonic-acid transferase